MIVNEKENKKDVEEEEEKRPLEVEHQEKVNQDKKLLES